MRRRDFERQIHEKDREISYLRNQNDQLLDKLLHVTGNTWTPPPERTMIELPDLPDYDFAVQQPLDDEE